MAKREQTSAQHERSAPHGQPANADKSAAQYSSSRRRRQVHALRTDLQWSARVLGVWSLAALAWQGLKGQAEPLAGVRGWLAEAEHLVPGIDQRFADFLVVIGDRSFDANTLAIAIVVVIWAMALAVVFTTLLRAEDAKSEADEEYEFYETAIDDDDDDDDASEGMPGRRLLH